MKDLERRGLKPVRAVFIYDNELRAGVGRSSLVQHRSPVDARHAARTRGGAVGFSSAVPALTRCRRAPGAKNLRDIRSVIGMHTTFEHHDAFSTPVLKAFIQEYRLKFPIALDQPNPVSPIPHTMERYKMRGTPSLVLIDRHGMVRKHAFGAVDDLRIGAEIGALIQESETAALARSSAA
jgi:hypothetical protein